MRRIVTAITAAALAFSLVAQATPASAAVTGYDSSYSGESAFLSLDQGDTGSFTVFFANTGTTTWATGTSTQVDLAACTEDKVTCNAQDSSDADFNDGWLSATRYATTTQSAVAPGQIGTFTYNVMVPADAAADTYRFNGALVLASTGADIHNEGYFQDVTVAEAAAGDAATLTELDPETGDVAGGDEVTITGTDFVCTPEFPTVLFGDNEAEVTSCGETELNVESPAGDATGDVDVTVTNTGAAASNALTFTYEDVTGPTFDSLAVNGQTITLTFSEPVCVDEDGDAFEENAEYNVTINGQAVTTAADTDASFTDCDADDFSATQTITIEDTAEWAIVEGDTVAVTITADGALDIQDEADNFMDAGATRSAEATADTTEPDIASAEVTATNVITLTFTEPVFCDEGQPFNDFTFTDADNDEWTGTASDCPTTAATADDEWTVTFTGAGIGQGDTGELFYDEDTAQEISDLSDNDLGDQTIDVTPLEADPPLIDDAVLDTSAGLSGTVDSGDQIVLTFNEDMAALAVGDQFRISDGDGSVSDIVCDATTLNAVDPTDDADLINAVCELTDDNEITIEIRDDGTVADEAADGDTPGLQYPATIIDTSGITDEESNAPDLANSADVVIEDE